MPEKIFCWRIRDSCCRVQRGNHSSLYFDYFKAEDGKYKVLLSDTVIFPTGGGQPNDTGSIRIKEGSDDVVQVINCERVGMNAIHTTNGPLPVGAAVIVSLDWERRFDHMQQHSGQHLISDLAEKLFNWKEKSYVEFKNVIPTSTQLDQLESAVNDFILTGTRTQVIETEINHRDRPEGLPSDIQEGVIRNVKMGEFLGPCCGTHVENTFQIQAVKLLTCDKVRGGNSRVWFLVGSARISRYINATLIVDKELNSLLSTGPADFPKIVSKKLQQIKDLMKEVKNLKKEMKELKKNLPSDTDDAAVPQVPQ